MQNVKSYYKNQKGEILKKKSPFLNLTFFRRKYSAVVAFLPFF